MVELQQIIELHPERTALGEVIAGCDDVNLAHRLISVVAVSGLSETHPAPDAGSATTTTRQCFDLHMTSTIGLKGNSDDFFVTSASSVRRMGLN